MLEVHIRTISAIDVLEAKLLPQRNVISINFTDAEGRIVELWSQETRSYPTLSDGEAEGAKFYDGLPEALTAKQAEQLVMEWVKANFLDVKNGSDRNLLYPRPTSGYVLIGN
jgi:hypothetical protein